MPIIGFRELAPGKSFVPILRRLFPMEGSASRQHSCQIKRQAYFLGHKQMSKSGVFLGRCVCACLDMARKTNFNFTLAVDSLAVSAIIYCSAQSYNTSSTTNDDGNHCKNEEGGSPNNIPFYVEYSRVGSKTDGAHSPGVVSFGAAMYLSRGAGPRQFGAAVAPFGGTGPQHVLHVVPLPGSTGLNVHTSNLNQRFMVSCHPRSVHKLTTSASHGTQRGRGLCTAYA